MKLSLNKKTAKLIQYRQAFKITLLYVVMGFLWILFSDRGAEMLFKDPEVLKQVQTVKGWFYVLVTGLVLFGLLILQFKQINDTARQLGDRNAFIHEIYNGINCVIVVWRTDGSIVEVNRYFTELLGYEETEVLGAKWFDVMLPEDERNVLDEVLFQLKNHGEINNFENSVITKSGEMLRLLWNDRIITTGAEAETYVISFGIDMTNSFEKDKEIKRLLYFDKTTDAPNAVKLELDCRQLIAMQRPFTLALADIQQLGKINTQFGIKTGDKLIQSIYRYLKAIYPQGQIYKWHAGSFIILIKEINREPIRKDMEALLMQLDSRLMIDGKEMTSGLNVGLSQYPVNGASFDELIHYASYASSRAKQSGQKKYKFFSDPMFEEMNQSIEAETKLAEVLDKDLLEIYLQPLVNLETDRIDSVEVLLRSFSEGFRFDSIVDFIKIAEHTGQIVDVDFWVIQKAFDLCQSNEALKELEVGVNLSAQTFTSMRFIPYLRDMKEAYGIPAGRIVFELTEHSVVDDFDNAKGIITQLKEMGFRVALDDFGSEYSSLKYLSKLQFDCIKIDKSFIDDLTASEVDREIIDGIIKLSRGIGVNVVAEGVETYEQYQCLKEMGCLYAQGYLISKPLSVSAMVDRIKRHGEAI